MSDVSLSRQHRRPSRPAPTHTSVGQERYGPTDRCCTCDIVVYADLFTDPARSGSMTTTTASPALPGTAVDR